jgi:hypothetical protein
VKPLGLQDIAPRAAYEDLRDPYRAQVIAAKARRRISVGDRVTIVFENRETLRFQIQEMCRVERIDDPAAVQTELDVYNELLPPEGGLSATLFIEIPELDAIKKELDRLVGIDEHVFLRVGDSSVAARFDENQMEQDRISAVQYIRFVLDAKSRRAFARADTPVSIHIDHPNYAHTADLSHEARSELALDLAGERESLLSEAQLDGGVAAAIEVIEEGPLVRVLRVAPGRFVAEPRAPAPVFLSQRDPGLAMALLTAVERVAANLGRETGTPPRISLDLSGDRPRWFLQG